MGWVLSAICALLGWLAVVVVLRPPDRPRDAMVSVASIPVAALCFWASYLTFPPLS